MSGAPRRDISRYFMKRAKAGWPMIAEDFPSAKDPQLIRCKSFAIMTWSRQGPHAGTVHRKGE